MNDDILRVVARRVVISTAWLDSRREVIIVGALASGALMQRLLANITSGEMGFLFRTFIAFASFEPRVALARGIG